MTFFQILACLLIGIGAAINYGAKIIVRKTKLDRKMTVDEAEELTEEELDEYMFNKATIRVKILGLLLMLPGVFLVYYAFR
ncbi:MAG TPA: hypothetical protein GX501_01255 [Clostridiaceae bacterium]|nr:hypothetical protein [Clostridiaceae bacterium]